MPSFIPNENLYDGDVRSALEELDRASRTSPKQRQMNLADVTRVITSSAYEHGLPSELLDHLIDIITRPTLLDQATVTALIKNMYPASRVPSAIVSKVVACLGPSKVKPSTSTQALLVRWLILVHNVLVDTAQLSKFYAILFNHLGMIGLRRPLCQLLSILTRRRHVKLFRIHTLMELAQGVGDSERELLGLLRIYKNYYPDIVAGEGGRTSFFFKNPDQEWADHLQSIQEANAVLHTNVDTAGSSFKVVRRGTKRSRVDVLPEVQTSRANEKSTTLEEVRNATEFVERFEKLETPNQAISMLSDPLAQKYLLLHPSETNMKRMEQWLDAFFADFLDNIKEAEPEDEQGVEIVLKAVLEFARISKTLPVSTERFLRAYLPRWDGRNADVVLPLLASLRLMSPSAALHDYFHPVEAALLTDDIESKAGVLGYYTDLLRHWSSWILAIGPQDYLDTRSRQWSTNSLTEVITRADLLASSILETPNPHGSQSHAAVLAFYKALSSVFAHAPAHGLIRLEIPAAPPIYNVAFTPAMAFVSPVCSILAAYKAAFEESMTPQQDGQAAMEPYSEAVVARFNGYVMDLCNLLWRSRALNSADPNALGCLIPTPVQTSLQKYTHNLGHGLALAPLFGLSCHPALSSISASYFRQAELEAGISPEQRLRGPVTQKRLVAVGRAGGIDMTWQNYRLNMIDWLDGLGITGIGELMRKTMKLLRDGKQNQ